LSVNAGAQILWGYGLQTEMVGHNVSKLMPLPYSAFHNSYLMRYSTTGNATVVGRLRQVVALHSDGTQFPVALEVSELKDKEAEVAGAGAKSAMSSAKQPEKGGKPAKGGKGDKGDKGMRGERAESVDSFDDGATANTHHSEGGILGAFAKGLKVFVAKITLAGQLALAGDDFDSEQAHLNDALLGRVGINRAGIIDFANEKLCKIFGYADPSHLLGRNISELTPEDIAPEHDGHLNKYGATRKATVIGVAGRQLFGRRRDGSLVGIALRVKERLKRSNGTLHTVFYNPRTLRPTEKVPKFNDVGPPPPKPPASSTTGVVSPFQAMPKMPDGHPGLPAGYGGGCPVMPAGYSSGCPVISSSSPKNMSVNSMQRLPPAAMGGCPVVGGSGPPKILTSMSANSIQLLPASASGGTSPSGPPPKRGSTFGLAGGGSQKLSPLSATTSPTARATKPSQLPLPDSPAIAEEENENAEAEAEESEEEEDDSTTPRDDLQEGQVFGDEWDGYEGFIYSLEELEAVVTINQAGIVLAANSAVCSFFGYWKEDLIGANIKVLMHSDVADMHDEYLASYKPSATKQLLGSRRGIEGLHRDGSNLKLIAEVAERVATKDGVDHRYFIGRIVLATQTRTQLEAQAKAAVKLLVSTKRKAQRQKLKAKLKKAAHQNLQTARVNASSTMSQAQRQADITAAMGLAKSLPVEPKRRVSIAPSPLPDPKTADESAVGTEPSKPVRTVRFANVSVAGSDDSSIAPANKPSALDSMHERDMMEKAKQHEKADGDDDQNSDGDRSSVGGSSVTDDDKSMNDSEIQNYLLGDDKSDKSSEVSASNDGHDNDDDDEDEEHAAEAKRKADAIDVGASTFMARHREKQLRQVSRISRITATTTSLYTAGAWVSILIALAAVLPFAIMEYLVSSNKQKLIHVTHATLAAVDALSIAADARRLDIARYQVAALIPQAGMDANASWYAPDIATSAADIEASVDIMNTLRDRLRVHAAEAEERHRALYWSVSSHDALRDIYEQPTFISIRHVFSSPSYNILYKTNLWDLGRNFAIIGRRIADRFIDVEWGDPDVGQVSVTLDNNNTLAFGRTLFSSGMLDEDMGFLLSNAPASSSVGWSSAISASSSSAETGQQTLLQVQIGILFAQIIAPTILIIALVQPLLRKAGAERVAMFRVFLRVPADVMYKLSRQVINVGGQESDDDTSDDGETDTKKRNTPLPPSGFQDPTKPGAESHHSRRSSIDQAITQSLLRKRSLKIQQANTSRILACRKSVTALASRVTSCLRRGQPQQAQINTNTSMRGGKPTSPINRMQSNKSDKLDMSDDPVSAQPAESKATFRLPAPIIASIVMVLGLIIIFFASGYSLIYSARKVSTNLRIAGLRSLLAQRIKFFAQELMVSTAARETESKELLMTMAAPVTLAGAHFNTLLSDDQFARYMAPNISGRLLNEGSRTLEDYVSYCRIGLYDAATALEKYHNALLYGDASLGLPDIDSSTAQLRLLFDHKCLRTESRCLPTSHTYYRVTTGGMHGIVLQYIDLAKQLANETTAVLSELSDYPSSSSIGIEAAAYGTGVPSGFRHARHEFLWTLAESDVAESLKSSLLLYQSEGLTFSDYYSIANGVLFSMLVVTLIAVYFQLFSPYVARIAAESKRAASLLRSLPMDVDLDRLQGEIKVVDDDLSSEGLDEGGLSAGSVTLAQHTLTK
jgi:PAS domain S-box-containing protein